MISIIDVLLSSVNFDVIAKCLMSYHENWNTMHVLVVLIYLYSFSSLNHHHSLSRITLFLFLIKSLNQVLAGGLVAQVVGEGHLKHLKS